MGFRVSDLWHLVVLHIFVFRVGRSVFGTRVSALRFRLGSEVWRARAWYVGFTLRGLGEGSRVWVQDSDTEFTSMG